VVGGGTLARRKARALLDCGARVVVVAGEVCDELRAFDGVEVVQRAFRERDVEGKTLVIAATDDPATNEAVWREAQATGCLVNVVDDPARCNFHMPATIRRGALTLSISTGGNSPALARRIRQTLEQQFATAYEPYVALLGELRPLVQEQMADPVRRKELWETLLDSNILELLRAGESQAAWQRAEEVVKAFR